MGALCLSLTLDPYSFCSCASQIEGVYNIQPPLPAIGGNEGVAKIIALGPGVKGLKVGDWVIPASPGFGTWRSYAVCSLDSVDPIESKGVPLELAATISVNPCSAYRMLHDFTTLKSGDLLVQNGANSSVGMAVIQLARRMGVKTLNVVRDRPNLAELKQRLLDLGATVVITEEELSNARMLAEAMTPFGDSLPILGLNCVGGSSASDIARLLKDGSNLVTYGGMSRKPVCVPTGRLIFNDLALRGFWLSRWTETHSKAERREMISNLLNIIREGEFKTFVTLKPFAQFEAAMAEARQGFKEGKIVLTY
jgi:trans-2-enoyl-CoA reductase